MLELEVVNRVEEALADLREGRMVVIVDDKQREDEGDLVVLAEKASTEVLNFMMQEGKGLICLSLDEAVGARLGLEPQASYNTSAFGTNFTESINLCGLGVAGASASGRVQTILKVMEPQSSALDFESPGFMFPLIAASGGVLRRRGQTEASVDMARLAGCRGGAVICEILGEDGEIVRGRELQDFCNRHRLCLVSVEDIARYRVAREILVRKVAESVVPELAGFAGEFRLQVFFDDVEEKEHLCITLGDLKDGALVRIHSECLTGDVFASKRCDCGPQLQGALKLIADEGQGALIYLYQEGRGIGLANKLRAYGLQDGGLDTVDANLELGFAADCREYRVAGQIIQQLGLSSIRLLTNNPRKVQAMELMGLQVSERVGLSLGHCDENLSYMRTKRDRLGHLIDV